MIRCSITSLHALPTLAHHAQQWYSFSSLRASLQARHNDGSLVAIKGLVVQAVSSLGQLEREAAPS